MTVPVTPPPPADDVQVIYSFQSVTLTDEYHLKVVGTQFKGAVTEEFVRQVNQAPALPLLKCLHRLALHMALLTEQLTPALLYPNAADPERELRRAVDSSEVYQHEQLLNFRCTSVTWKSKGTILAGERRTKYKCFGKAVEVKTPPTVAMAFADDDEEEGNYPFFQEWHEALGDLQAEVQGYLEGHYGKPEDQLNLFDQLAAPGPAASFQDMVDNAPGFTSLTISDSMGRGVTLEKGKKAQRTLNGQVLDDDE